jgi:hypothetical protein
MVGMRFIYEYVIWQGEEDYGLMETEETWCFKKDVLLKLCERWARSDNLKIRDCVGIWHKYEN